MKELRQRLTELKNDHRYQIEDHLFNRLEYKIEKYIWKNIPRFSKNLNFKDLVNDILELPVNEEMCDNLRMEEFYRIDAYPKNMQKTLFRKYFENLEKKCNAENFLADKNITELKNLMEFIIYIGEKHQVIPESLLTTMQQRLQQLESSELHKIQSYKMDNINHQMAIINNKLDSLTKNKFKLLLELEPINFTKLTPNSPIVSGDTDGSVGREILLAIQAGVMILSEYQLNDLAHIISEELCLKLKNYQSDPTIKACIDRIAQDATYQIGIRPLIFIGDVLFDRYTNNMDAGAVIREQLKKHGVRYILGNHDWVKHDIRGGVGGSDITKYNSIVQSAEFAFTDYSRDTPEGIAYWCKHQNTCFINCHYDPVNHTIYLHNGLKLKDDSLTVVITAFGEIDTANMASIEEFVEEINRREPILLPLKENFTNFRPEDSEIRDCIKKIKLFKNMWMIHGHNGSSTMSFEEGVLNLNSRIAKHIIPVAAIVGERIND